MKTAKKFLAVITVLFTLTYFCSAAGFYASANNGKNNTGDLKILTESDVESYQNVINQVNKKFGYDFKFDEILFTEQSPYKSPLSQTLKEFENELLDAIKFMEYENSKAAEAIAQIGSENWKSAPKIEDQVQLPLYSYSQLQANFTNVFNISANTPVSDTMNVKSDFYNSTPVYYKITKS
jgi:hypothetical protein